MKPDWLSDVPLSWKRAPFGSIFTQSKRKNMGLQRDFVLSVMKDRGVIPHTEKGNVGNKVSEDLSGYKLVDKGDFVLNSMNLYMGSVGVSAYSGVTSSAYIICKPIDGILPKYYEYLIQFKGFQEYVGLLGKGIMEIREAVRWTSLKSVFVPIPDLNTQRAIADFLDRETAIIDLLIDKKQRLITLLEEKFDAQLYYAISGGDSNITDYPHLSPSYWSRRSVRSITQSHKQGYYTTEDYTTSGYRLIRITDIGKNGDIFSNKAPYVQDVDSAKPFLLKSGDFVFARTGGAGALGVFMDESEKSVFASYLIRFRFMAICNPIFLKYFFLSRCFQDAVSRDLHGGVLQNLSAENIKQQTIALPPMEEQVEIADRLEQLAVRHEKTRGVITASLERLREYRSALITAAVTGQIDIAKRGKGATAYRQLDAIHAEFTQ